MNSNCYSFIKSFAVFVFPILILCACSTDSENRIRSTPSTESESLTEIVSSNEMGSLIEIEVSTEASIESASSIDFYKMVTEDIDNTKLTIYYQSLDILTRSPWSVEDLINNPEHKVVIDGNTLKQHLYLFEKMNDVPLYALGSDSKLDCRLYYIVENTKRGKLFDVAMWYNGNALINGEKTADGKYFYDVLTTLCDI